MEHTSRASKQPRIYEGGWFAPTRVPPVAVVKLSVRSCPDLLCNPPFAINAPIARKPCTHAPSIKVSPYDNPLEPSVTNHTACFLPGSSRELVQPSRMRTQTNIGCLLDTFGNDSFFTLCGIEFGRRVIRGLVNFEIECRLMKWIEKSVLYFLW